MHPSTTRLASLLRWAAFIAVFLATALGLGAQRAQAADPVSEVRLYALDCGHLEAKDIGFLSDTGEYDGKPGAVGTPCFVIRHPKGILLWDTGLGDKLAESKAGLDTGGGHMTVPVTLAEQLKTLGLLPADVTFMAFSHMHFDHTGNANLFASGTTWLINQAELGFANSKPTPLGIQPDVFSAYKQAKTIMLTGDHDVFRDGSVRILKTPGHTPGHQVLLVKLKKSGVVVLSGDLWHQRASVKPRRVPVFNASRADTLASMDRIEKILANTKGRLVVQHDLADFKALPKFPAYLQ
jgi:N-acyl homoserine lactone hydrolase